MIIDKQTQVTKDVAKKKIVVVRDFDASLEKVWRAWTEKELLDQWWAPRPWRAETKSMDFREGGAWLYSMVGPEGERHWCRMDYKTIREHKSFTVLNGFSDEKGVMSKDFPVMDWKTEFIKAGDFTTVRTEIHFDTEADMNKILEMGFQEGFTMALGNLDELLEK
jgi:uncharacterized protein YndB with AHSA1/START domain